MLKDIKPDAQSYSSSIGDNKTVTLDFSAQIGGPRQNDVGLFMEGMSHTNTVDVTSPTFTMSQITSAGAEMSVSRSGDMLFTFDSAITDSDGNDLQASDFVIQTGVAGDGHGGGGAGFRRMGTLLVADDANGFVLVNNENDRRFFGSYIPSLVSSFNLKVIYKNFDVNIATSGSFGNKVYNGKKAQRFGNENIEQFVFNNRWTSGRPSTNTPVASNNVPLSSNYFLESGDYFRINNFTIGYTFKREKSKLFNNTRLYFTAKNPLILKKFSGYTPELPGDPMGLAGVELDAYPTLSSYYIGIKMSL